MLNNSQNTKGKTPFDLIDERLYGKEKFSSLKEKIEWVCQNFYRTQIGTETNEEWANRITEEK